MTTQAPSQIKIEKLMLARVKFQNQLADLRLTDVTESVSRR